MKPDYLSLKYFKGTKMSCDHTNYVQQVEEHEKTQDYNHMELLYKKWATELAVYLADLHREQQENHIYALAEELTAWWEDIDKDYDRSDTFSSDSYSFEEEEDLEEKIRQYKLDLRCNIL